MPAATREARGLTTALDDLRADLGGADLQLDVVGLRPLHSDPDRRLSRAEVDVLVSAADSSGADRVVAALLNLQAGGRHQLAPWSDPANWSALGRPPQAAFIVIVVVELALEVPQAPLVRFPLEAEPFDRHHNADAERRR